MFSGGEKQGGLSHVSKKHTVEKWEKQNRELKEQIRQVSTKVEEIREGREITNFDKVEEVEIPHENLEIEKEIRKKVRELRSLKKIWYARMMKRYSR